MDATGPLNEHRALGESTGGEGTGNAGRPAVKQPALAARDTADPGVPAARGLYDPALDKDSCGVGFIADIKGRKSHQIVEDALTILVNLEHRGAVGADPRAGDGAGILVQIPHALLRPQGGGARLRAARSRRIRHRRAVHAAMRKAGGKKSGRSIAEEIAAEGMELSAGATCRPTIRRSASRSSRPSRCTSRSSSARAAAKLTEDEFERRLYLLRKTISGRLYTVRERRTFGYYPVSMSCRTVIYKGMFLADQLGAYYPDLHEPDFVSALALVHQRFSTNTFPTWSLAHPYRMIAHNGEINTLRGNRNWMAARQASARSPYLRRRHQQAVADLLRGPVGHRLLRQRARVPGARRLSARPCGDDDDSGGVGRQSADGRGAARLLRVQRRR